MKDFVGRARLKYWLDRLEPFIEGVLFLLSAGAVLFVVINEFVPDAHVQVPWLGMTWEHLRNRLQEVTWSAFILDVALYGVVSRRPFVYARHHIVELTICVCWNPFTTGVLLQHVTSILSLQTLLVIGTVAHVVRLARWCTHRFNRHPLVTVVAAAVVLVTASAAALTHAEPETFHNFQDAAFSVYMTIFTVGSDTFPKSLSGRLLMCAVTACGIALGTLFLSTAAPLLGRRLNPGANINEKLLDHLAKQGAALEELIKQQRESNELTRRHIALLEEQLHGTTPGSGAPPPESKGPPD